MATDDLPQPARGLTSSGDQAPDSVAQQLSEVARTLQAEPDLDATLRSIAAAAVINIPGADYAAITLVAPGGKVSTPAVSEPLVEQVEDLQNQTNQGPCLSSAREHITVRANDLRTEDRWPLFARRAADLGVRSMLSFQLYVRDGGVGALNLYGREPNAFDDDDETIGLLFASHAAVALVGAQQQHHAGRPLQDRDVIGQAKGVLMERHKIDAQHAFAILAKASQDANRKLVDIATVVTETGQIPRRKVV